MFYFSPPSMASHFRSQSPSLLEYASALLNGGYQVSRSHAQPGSLKTDAPTKFVHDVLREFQKTHPVRRDKIADTSPANVILDREQTYEVSFDIHERAEVLTKRKEIVRYQQNPTTHWGPAPRARNARTATKGKPESVELDQGATSGGVKREAEEAAEPEQKRPKLENGDEEVDIEAMMNDGTA